MKVTISAQPQEHPGQVHPYIYGQYFEHLGNCIYPSVSDENSPLSDANGLRRDVIEAARELGVPVIRWPGGCFVDLYDWKDGVGPRAERPVRYNWHWGGLESNRFGTDEFLQWCEAVGADPYINVNLGTGTLIDALRWIDYCNGSDTSDAAWRRANGREEPYRVKLWGIGNETWGHWEAGQLSAGEYAHKLANWAQFAKKYDEGLQLLGVGSSEGKDSEWDRRVVERAGRYLHYLTIHIYGCSVDRASGDEYYPVVFTPVYFEQQMRQMIHTVDEAVDAGGVRPRQPIRLSLDEWNIRHYVPDAAAGAGRYRLDRGSPRNLQDAIFVAGVLNAMIRLSPAVGMANYVFLVNGNGVMTVTEDKVIKTPLYHVFRQYREWMLGELVHLDVQSPSMLTPPPQVSSPEHTKEVARTHQPVAAPFVDAVAVKGANGELNVALVNRHRTDSYDVRIKLPEAYRVRRTWTLTHDDIYASNTVSEPDKVVPLWSENRPLPADETDTVLHLEPHSVQLVQFLK